MTTDTPLACLKTYRDDNDLTQGKLAEELGVRRTTIARWEAGSRKINKKLLSHVSSHTKISASALRPDLAELLGPQPTRTESAGVEVSKEGGQ